MLSIVYRFLCKLKKRDEVTRDMQIAFEEAREEARSAGWRRYFVFAVKEVAGLFDFSIAKLWWVRLAGWAAAGLATGWLVSVVLPSRYTSEAALRLAPSAISADLLPRDAFSVDDLLAAEKPVVTSRSVVSHIINEFDLYPNLRTRCPLDSVVEDFRKSLRIESSGASTIRVTFTYGDVPGSREDRLKAQRVASEMVSRLVDEGVRESSSRAFGTVQFFKDRSDAVGKAWATLNASLEKMQRSNPQYDLLRLARDQKAKEFESIEQKRGDAEALSDLWFRKQDRFLELIDPPSLPEEADTSRGSIVLVGLACGIAIGGAHLVVRALRQRPLNLPTAEAAG